MKQDQIIEILHEALKGKNMDLMTYQELRESLITLTGIIVGMLLVTNRDPKDIKKLME